MADPGRGRWQDSPLVAVAAAVIAIGALLALGSTGPSDQWTWTIHAVDELAKPLPIDPRDTGLVWWDFPVIALYVAAAYLVHRDTARRTRRIDAVDPGRFAAPALRVRRWSTVGFVYLATAGLVDVVENVLVITLPDAAGERRLSILQAATWVKLVAFFAGVAVLLCTAYASAVRARDVGLRGRDDDPPRPDDPEPGPDCWEAGRATDPTDEWAPDAGRRGVCLSGGGIRSASFSLGALQAISHPDRPQKDIRYIASVSGGGYMAAAWASLTRDRSASATPEGDGPARPFEPRSAAERWVRHHTDYLVSNLGALSLAILVLVGGILLNLLVLFGMLQVVAHPIGWVIGSAHPEQRAELPIIEIEEQPELAVGPVTSLGEGEWSVALVRALEDEQADTSELPAGPIPLELRIADAVDEEPVSSADPPILVIHPARLAMRDGNLEVVRQPLAVLESRASSPAAPDDDVRLHLEIHDQPTISVEDLPAVDEEIHDLVAVDQQVEVRQLTGTVGRQPLNHREWMAMAVAGLAALAMAAWLLDERLRRLDLAGLANRTTVDRNRTPSNHASIGLAQLTVGVAALLFVVPTASRNLVAWLSHLPGYDSSEIGWRAFGTGLLAAIPLVMRIRGGVSRGLGRLQGFRGTAIILDVVLGIIVSVGLLSAFLLFVDLASANGVHGHLTGFHDGWVPFEEDWQRWTLALLVPIGMVVIPISSHKSSLYTFYRARLAVAYFLRRADGGSGRIQSMTTREQHAWWWVRPKDVLAAQAETHALSKADEAMADAGDADVSNRFGPALSALSSAPVEPGAKRPSNDVAGIEEWVVCATANIRGAGEAAPGRASGSMTFSRSWVGGPEVGWMRTVDYLAAIGPSRRKDVSVPSTVTISGAAFSPGMGKAGRSWQGRIMAVLNLRLGVWVPNPMLVAARRRRPLRRPYGSVRRPNPIWYLREVVGWFDRTAPFVYVTDGGHWENLGLVELLRRGCGDIWMISAAGDGTSSFETLAQAMALAREELGVELDLELETLRAPSEPAEGPVRRLLRRQRGREQEVPTAAATFVRGTVRYPSGVVGTIHVVEATLAGDLPWDVHAYAEKNNDFPDVSTGYQLMDHRDFEAYRMLGYVQTARALEDAGEWITPKPTTRSRRPAGGR